MTDSIPPDDARRAIDIFLNAPENPTPEELEAYIDEACGNNDELRAQVDALFDQNRVKEITESVSSDDDRRDIDIFLKAPKNPSTEKLEAYLDKACGNDDELRARVEALFAQDQETIGIVDHAPKIGGIPMLNPRAAVESEGSTIGPYKLLQNIGEGGFGTVYMAEQTEPMKRRVALKIIKLGMDTKQVVARFEAERQALAMMDHPHIAKVHDAGATETGRPYFVMELVRGIPITKFCDEQNLDTEERLQLFVDVCHAVQHAHQKGVIHRDLKPSNVMVTMHDDKPVVKVIDFGVAKATQSDLTEKTLFTQFEQFIGTPAYMSPEQAQFSGLDIDTRSDIYTLGVLLYELLTGTTPFDSKELREAGLDEIRRIIKEDEPAIPSARLSTLGNAELTDLAKHRHTPASKLRSLVRGELDWIVMKALEKDRTRRYETANALAADIGRHLADEPVVAAAPSASYRLSKYVRKYRGLFATAAVIAVTLLVASIVSTWMAIDASKARSVAQEATSTAQDQRERARKQELDARHRFVEQQFAAGDSAVAVAHLAKLIREDRTNTIAAERMLCAIRQRPFPRLLQNFGGHQWEMGALSSDGTMVVTASPESGRVQVLDTETGKRLGNPMQLSEAGWVNHVSFSYDDSLLLVGKEDFETRHANASVFDWKSGKRVCPPLRLEATAQLYQFSPDGKFVLMGCPGKTLIWDIATGEPCFEKPIWETGYMGTFSPDSKLVAFSRTGKIVDARTGKLLRVLGFPWLTYRVNFSPDGKRLIGCSPDGGVRIADVESGELLGILRHTDQVPWAEFSPDGTSIVTACRNGSATIWDAQTFQRLKDLVHHDWKLESATFSSDGQRVVVTAATGGTRIWDLNLGGSDPLNLGTANFQKQPQQKSVLGLDNTMMLNFGGFSSSHLWKLGTPQPVSQIFRHREDPIWNPKVQGVWAVNFSPDGELIVTTAVERDLGVWDAWTSRRKHRLPMRSGRRWRAEFSGDGAHIMAIAGRSLGRVSESELSIWNTEDGENLCQITTDGVLNHAALSPVKNAAGDYLVVAAPLGIGAQLYNARTGAAVGDPLTYGGEVLDTPLINNQRATFSPDGSRVVTGATDGSARVWSVPAGKLLVELKGHHRAPLDSVMFSADGHQIVTASGDGTAAIWNAHSGEIMHILRHGSVALTHAEFSPAGTRVVTASVDGTARIWHAESGEPIGLTLRHDQLIRRARFSPSGDRIVTFSGDWTARLWDAETGRTLSEPLKHEGAVEWASFSPDGRRVATSGRDSLARIWDLPPAPAGSVPEWVAGWAEAVAGLRVLDDDTMEPLTPDELRDVKEEVLSLPDDDYYAKTAKWFYADKATRLITPFSRITVGDWVENRVEENTIASLQEALRVAPDHTVAELKLARAFLEAKTTDRATNLRHAERHATRATAGDERENLLAEIASAQSWHRLSTRVSELEQNIQSAKKRGQLKMAAALYRAASLGRLIIAASTDSSFGVRLELVDAVFPPTIHVSAGAGWRYLDTDQDRGVGWSGPDYDDASWKSGVAPLGFGNDGEVTEIEGRRTMAMAYYFRHKFEMPKQAPPGRAVVRIRCDDGAVVYLNGVELVRHNMPDGEIGHDTSATESVSGEWEQYWWDFEVDAAALRPDGESNLLAVELHQKHRKNGPSSDLGLDLSFLHGLTREAYTASLTDADFREAIAFLTMNLPEDRARKSQLRWESLVLRDSETASEELLGLRAKVLLRLGRADEALASIEALATMRPGPTSLAEAREQISLTRAKIECLKALDRHDEAEKLSVIRDRPPTLDPNFLDLRSYYTRSFHHDGWVGEESPDYWTARLQEIFDPGDGPDFDLRGAIQLNSGIYPGEMDGIGGKDVATQDRSDYPDRVSIEIGKKFGAVHFLQSCLWGWEAIGGEVARYIVHYEDGSRAIIPVIFGQDTTDYWIGGRHQNYYNGIEHLPLKQAFKGSNSGSSPLALARQSWTNPFPDKTVSHLDFVSAKVKAAPFVVGITLESRDDAEQRTAGFDEQLAALDVEIGQFPSDHAPADVRRRRALLRKKVSLLEGLGRHAEAGPIADEIISVPPRPPGLSPKMIDLSSAYTESLFRPVIGRIRDRQMERIPERFEPTGGPDFDIRGMVQLESGVYNVPDWRKLDGKKFGQFWGTAPPEKATIDVGQTFEKIHFLQTCFLGREEEAGHEVARYVVHYQDGSTEPIPVVYGKDMIDNAVNPDKSELAAGIEHFALEMSFTNEWENSSRISLTRQTWQNPHAKKQVTHIGFISSSKMAAPCLLGITVE